MKAAAVVAWFLAVMAYPGMGRAEDESGGAERKPRTLAPYFFVENGDPAVDQVPLESTAVDVVVSGVIANVRVRQVYVNRGSRPIHARYVFPGSTRAAVHGMTMTIGDRRVVARIQERDAALATYEKARSEGKSASLLEQSRPNVFSMRVANIVPGDRVEVELQYTELLTPEERVYEFVFPTVVGPRYSNEEAKGAPEQDRFVASPYLPEGAAARTRFDIRVALEAGVPMHELTCPSHKTWTEWDGTSKAVVRLDSQESHGGNRDFILRYRLAGERIASGLVLYQGPDEGFLLVMAQPPLRVAESEVPPREYIFVVDVSGSMTGFPLDTAKELLRDLIGRLKPTDTFNVLLFSGTSHLMAPRSVPASAENTAAAIRVIDEQRGGGGTELNAALFRALQVPRTDGFARSVVLVTDGFISAEADVFRLIGANLGRTNFFAFGIGSSVNRHLIEGVARAGQGEPFVVTGPEEAANVSERFRRYIESPVLTSISIVAEGFDAYDLEPAGFPDLLAERPLVALGKWRGTPTGRIVIRGQERERTLRAGARRRRGRPRAREPGAPPALGARARRRPRGLWADRLRGGAPGRDRLPRPEVLPAHGLHFLRGRARGGEESGRRGPRCEPAAPAPGRCIECGGRHDPGLGARADLRAPRPRAARTGGSPSGRATVGELHGDAAVKPFLRENGPALAASVLLAAGAKIAYSRAGPDDLRFITGPTQALVGLASGIDFTYEAGYGYVSLAHRLVLSKSCTGVNFLLAVFGLLVSTLVPATPGGRRKLLLVGALAACAYGVTVLVNALRILIAVSLHDGGFAWGWLSAGRVHRLAGIVVYFLSLVGVHVLARHAAGQSHGGAGAASPLLMAPLLAYGLVALALPLLNGALAANPLLFAEHCAWIVLVVVPLSMAATYGVDRHR